VAGSPRAKLNLLYTSPLPILPGEPVELRYEPVPGGRGQLRPRGGLHRHAQPAATPVPCHFQRHGRQVDHCYPRISVASAAAVISKPINTFASTRVRDGSLVPAPVGSRTLALTRLDAAGFGLAAALVPPDPPCSRLVESAPVAPDPVGLDRVALDPVALDPVALEVVVAEPVRPGLPVPLAPRLAALSPLGWPEPTCLASRHAGRSRM
jgi:hypothetical protein